MNYNFSSINKYTESNFIFSRSQIYYFYSGKDDFCYKDNLTLDNFPSGIYTYNNDIIAAIRNKNCYWSLLNIQCNNITTRFPSYHILMQEILSQEHITVNYNIEYKKENELCINVYDDLSLKPNITIISDDKSYSILSSELFMFLLKIPEIRNKLIKPMQKGLAHKMKAVQICRERSKLDI